MKLQLLVSTGILLGALLPRCPEGRALGQGLPEGLPEEPPSAFREQPPRHSLPALLRLGEEYFLRLGSLRKTPAASSSSSFSSTSTSSSSSSSSSSSHLAASASGGNFFRAAVQQLHQSQHLRERSVEGALAAGAGAAAAAALSLSDPWGGEAPEAAPSSEAVGGKEKRSEEPPISLDLTFHLLREVLEMARAEQLAQQAHSNRKLMESIGK